MTKFDRDSNPSRAIDRPSSGQWPSSRRLPAAVVRPSGVSAAVPQELVDIIRVLERYLSSVNAKLLVERALREKALTTETFAREDLVRIGGGLRRGVELFVKPGNRKEALEAIGALCGPDTATPEPSGIDLGVEGDIVSACNQARRMCETAGAKSFAMHKVMTIVSELSRNIVSYAGTGRIELTLTGDKGRTLAIRATDNGSGIDNLEEIMSGRYQSKTGLGKGIIGTKRLSDRFDISTGPNGTVVCAEINL